MLDKNKYLIGKIADSINTELINYAIINTIWCDFFLEIVYYFTSCGII